MRWVVPWALALCLAASASAITPSTSNVFRPEQKPWNEISRQDGVRVHGDTVGDPFIVGSLPFTASGSTNGFANDYDYACPYTGSTSADVVYKYVEQSLGGINIDLCASTYDTKVYVYANTVGNVIACNDDCCSYQSYLHNVPTTTGNTYYIVVDGYGGSCGSYYIRVDYWLCSSAYECPPDAMLEGEPECYEGYNDTYNGGCNAVPFPVFQNLEPTGDDIVICGTTGVFQFNTLLCRDTDWYQMDITATSNICLSGDSEAQCHFSIIDGRGGCKEPPVVAYGVATPCVPVSDICYTCEPGTWWAWVGPGWDTSYACGSIYIMTITGYTPDQSSVPEEGPGRGTTWGRVKSMFR